MIERLTSSDDRVLAFKLSGKLHDEDYKTFVPLIDESIAAHGKTRVLAVFHEFSGWDVAALWDDIKFSTTHCTKIERLALVGESTWEKYMASVCKPFTMATIKYFDVSELDAAWAWVTSDA
ncbi:SpoIIAA family protein [Lacunimicrobium album]